MQNPNPLSINLHRLEERVRSKKELYEFLTLDCHAYLPKIESTNVYFFRDIIQGQKNYLNRDLIHVAQVPHYEGLTVNDILNFARQNQNILSYLPDESNWLHCDRKWICDMIYSLDQIRFQEFIDHALSHRKEKLEQSQDLLLLIRPEFLQALNNTLSFSCKFEYYLNQQQQLKKDAQFFFLRVLLIEIEENMKQKMSKKKNHCLNRINRHIFKTTKDQSKS